ncbi:diaminopimelate decarboxylase [Noviherbaspirillum autotrophicum]|uniref:Diaminopimelate decarboxylase n=2 Tax=Noviherbaspirillum autotrophicum TaxID=709839 RepID=A0A0C2BNE7_9BURK|nr:diaminopimelate decarboxylase [Noviherbaspirillum autotrophicum]
MTDTMPRKLPFPVVDNCLQVGGVPLTRLAQRVGRTPFYAYDRGLLTARAKTLRATLPRQVRLHYSVKANPMPALVQHMAGLVDGCDVSSAGELKVVLDTGMAPEHISFSGPGKREDELARAVAAGVLINIESMRELQCVARSGDRLGIRPRVAVRVNPDFELKSSGMRMGGGAKQFGIDAELAPQVLRQIAALGLDFVGLHVFSGSQCLKAEAIIEAQARTLELAVRLAQHAPQDMRLLNMGGGFGVPYFSGENELDIRSIGDHLAQVVSRLEAQLPQAQLAIELGRYLVSEAGIYVTRIIDRKVSRGHAFLVADGGMHHHLAASGNLGQVIRKNYPVLIGNRVAAHNSENTSVVGPLCTPLDLIADKIDLPPAKIGDLVVVLQSGAYGLTASPTAFLGHPVPEEVLV